MNPVAAEQQAAPDAQQRRDKRPNVYYPQCRVTISVVFENFGDPKAPKIIPVVPRSVTIQTNSYKEADTWSMEFDAKDLPVTPELVRGGSVEIYLFNTRGIGQAPTSISAPDPDSHILKGLRPCITGVFDEVTVEASEDGRVASIEGTDYTALFIAKKWNPKDRVPCGKRLDETVRALCWQVPSVKDTIKVVVEPAGLVLPKVGDFESRTSKKKGIPHRGDKTYWDVIYELVVRHGFICFVRVNELIIAKPQTLFVEGATKVRNMAWGRNLKSLRMKRRMAKETVPTIEVHSYDERTKKQIVARYPKTPKQQAVTGLGTKKDEVLIVNAHGVRSQAMLYEMAQSRYELMSRAEQEVEICTMDLTDLAGEDLIELRTGDAITIGFEAMTNDLMESASEGQRRRILAEFGYEPAVIETIVSNFDKINLFKRPFRVKESTIEWSHDGGLTINAQLQNYVNIQGQNP